MSRVVRLALALLSLRRDARARARRRTPRPRARTSKSALSTIENDARYEPIRAYERIILKKPEHPLAGAELGVDEAAAFARVLNADITLDPITVKSSDDVAPAVLAALAAGTHFFLLDAPAEAFKPLAAAVRGRDALIFNVSEPDDALRRDLCAAEFVHVYPSRAQLMDGLVQFVVSRKWRDLLVLQGAAPERRRGDGGVCPFGAKIRRPHRRAEDFQARHRPARARR